MYQDLWVATDGVTTVRFADRISAYVYCEETDWNISDLIVVRHKVVENPKTGQLHIIDWTPAMEPELGEGQWLEAGESEPYTVWLPDLSPAALEKHEISELKQKAPDWLYVRKVMSEKGLPFREANLLLPE